MALLRVLTNHPSTENSSNLRKKETKRQNFTFIEILPWPSVSVIIDLLLWPWLIRSAFFLNDCLILATKKTELEKSTLLLFFILFHRAGLQKFQMSLFILFNKVNFPKHVSWKNPSCNFKSSKLENHWILDFVGNCPKLLIKRWVLFLNCLFRDNSIFLHLWRMKFRKTHFASENSQRLTDNSGH